MDAVIDPWRAMRLDANLPWWKAYFDLFECYQCGRTEGLRLGLQRADFTVIACDCNYQHIRPSTRASTPRPLTLLRLPKADTP